MPEPYFKETTPLGVVVSTTPRYWARIVTFKHPVMRGKEELVQRALRDPSEIRRSKRDESVHLYYAPDPPYHVCVVVKCEDREGFIVTAYRTEKIKEGDRLWPPP